MIDTYCPMCGTGNRVHPDHKLIECPCGCWYTPASEVSPRGDSGKALPIDGKQRKKLIALADRLILMSNGLTSEQTSDAIALANEFAPLAEYVIESTRGTECQT